MKKFIQLLLKKRFKILKNKRGFSLIEVLVAVAIIGIISAIAVPQFIAQKDEAAKVAADTSAGNIAKAFKNCIALNSFTSCNTLSAIKLSCPAGATCKEGSNVGDKRFCAHIHKGGTGNSFKVCISIDEDGNERRSYGGDLISNTELVCHTKVSGCTGGVGNKTEAPQAGLKTCTSTNSLTVCGAASTTNPTTNCVTEHSCKNVTTVGDCQTTGHCS